MFIFFKYAYKFYAINEVREKFCGSLETFGGLASSELWKAIVHKIQRENFRISSS